MMPERSMEVQKEVGNRRSRGKSSRSMAIPLEEESDAERIEDANHSTILGSAGSDHPAIPYHNPNLRSANDGVGCGCSDG